jgi:hypothetical protein
MKVRFFNRSNNLNAVHTANDVSNKVWDRRIEFAVAGWIPSISKIAGRRKAGRKRVSRQVRNHAARKFLTLRAK